MNIFGWIILLILISIVFILSISIFLIIKNTNYFNEKDKQLIIFIIDMYIEYGEEIEITSKDKHDIIIKELDKIKKRLINER